jgi:hypothetical protein
MLKENEITIKQIEEIQQGLINSNMIFARGSGKTGLLTARFKLYSGYEAMKSFIRTADMFVSIDDANYMIKEAWLKADDTEQIE